MMSNPKLEDIIFPQSQSPSISHLLTSLRRSNLTIHNRLTSILADAHFVLRARSTFPDRPLIANERCGSWYIRPENKGGSAYFKSTDGHERAWKFSTRRLNLHLVPLIEENDGIIIVDSTRRGKRMPDALSTTIPIWCTVLNQTLLPSHPLSKHLFLAPSHSASTHAQVTALIPSFVASLQALHLAPLPTGILSKPLRPFWVTQDMFDESNVRGMGDVFEEYRPVVCCTASKRVVGTGSEADEGGYIQGAADDTENWAHGLTPDVFWKYTDELLEAAEDDLPTLIPQLVEKHKLEKQNAAMDDRIQLAPHISVCPLPVSSSAEEICIALTPEVTKKEAWEKSRAYMEIGLGQGKTASRNLRTALPDIRDFVSHHPDIQRGSPKQIVVACESGKDLSVGTALALSCSLFDDENQLRAANEGSQITKSLIKRRLGTFMTAYPAGNPSRNTLQSVNSFLIDW